MHAADAPSPFVYFVLHPFLFPWFGSQLNTFEMKSRLSRFIAEDPQDVPLPREEALRLSTEAFRLWAVAAGYGQACDLYRYSSGLERRAWRAQRSSGHPIPKGWVEGSPGSVSSPFRLSCLTFSDLLQ